jgi:hypothetical protein
VRQLNGGAKKRLSVSLCAAKFVACRVTMRGLEPLSLILQQIGDDRVIASVCVFTITIPSKTQAYIAAGKPILMAVDGDTADLVRAAGCGVVSESDSPQALVAEILALMEISVEGRTTMTENGLRSIEKNCHF